MAQSQIQFPAILTVINVAAAKFTEINLNSPTDLNKVLDQVFRSYAEDEVVHGTFHGEFNFTDVAQRLVQGITVILRPYPIELVLNARGYAVIEIEADGSFKISDNKSMQA